MRKRKEEVQTDLLKECMQKHVEWLQGVLSASDIYERGTKDGIKDLKKQLSYCSVVLSNPLELSKEEREFLLIEYSPVSNLSQLFNKV